MSTVKGKEHWLYNHEKRICPKCGKEFEAFPSEKKKFCSIECSTESKKQRGNCLVCGKEVNRKSSKYCSRKCMGIDRQKRITKICSVCGKKFDIRPCENRGNNNVCSKECSDILKHIKPQFSDEDMTEYLIELKERIGRIPNLTDLKTETETNARALHWSLYVRRGGLQYWQKKIFGKITYYFTWENQCIEFFNKVLGNPEFKTQKTFAWLKHYKEGMKKPGTLRIDLYYPKYKLCVEFDGEGHFKEIDWKKGNNESLEEVQERDELKDKLVKEHGLKMLRFKYNEPLTIEYVMKRLNEFIDFA